MTVFCQAGAIAVPRAYRGLFTYLEPSVVEVVPPNRDAIFHPKVWVIRYRDTATGDSRYRLLCASRNLTFDRSWDTILRLDGVQGTGHATSDRLARFVTRLGSLAVRPVPVDRQAALATLASGISTVDFELPGDVRQLAFWPLGLGGDTDPFQGPIQRMLVVSPFLTTGMAARFGRRGAPNILVSRPESFDLVGADALTGFGETLVLSEVATPSLDRPEFVTTTAESEVTTEAIAERPGIEPVVCTPSSTSPTCHIERECGPALPMPRTRPTTGTWSSWSRWRGSARHSAWMRSWAGRQPRASARS